MADLSYLNSSMPVQIVNEATGTIASIDSNGNFGVNQNPASNIEGGGKVSVGTSAVEATFSSTPKSIIIRADKNNTGLLFVGKSGVTNAGANALTFLKAGDAIVIDYDDTSNAVWVVSDTSSQYFWKGCIL